MACVGQVMGDIYMYDNDNELFILLDDGDHDEAEELQRFLNKKDKKWF